MISLLVLIEFLQILVIILVYQVKGAAVENRVEFL